MSVLDAIDLAKRNYPSIRAASLKAEAAREGIVQAKTAYLPRLDLLLDENYGTANNITGFLAPQSIVPNISGTVLKSNNFLGGFGFTSAALVSWQPFDFGLRKANVDVQRFATKQAQSQIAVNELQTMSQAADAFLSVIAAQQVIRAAESKVERWKVFAETVQVLVQKQLKPATDQFLAEAELISAKDELIAARQNYKVALAALVRWSGITGDTIEVQAAPLVYQAPENHFTVYDLYQHPQAVAQESVIDVIRAQRHAIERTWYPEFRVRVPVYARGSSFQPDLSLNFGQGYYPTKFNYAISALVTFPVMDTVSLRSQRRAAIKNELAERAHLDEIFLNLKQQDAQAAAMIEASSQIAANAPIKLKAAQEAAESTRIRYRFQLVNVNDVAQNEQLLTQAQVDYATAQLQVWRALLALATAHGNLAPFIDLVAKAAAGSR